MSLRSQLKKVVTGLTVPQEYCCLEREGLQQPLSMSITLKDQSFQRDVTESHLFLGYKPLIIGLTFSENNQDYLLVKEQTQICLSFHQHQFEGNDVWRDFPTDQKSVARLILRKIGEKVLNNQVLLLYEGEYGEHTFLKSWHQFINRQREKMRRSIPGNISLPGNLLDQVRIAYAIPRLISIITVSDGSLLNMFPTDLHGPMGNTGYVGSLRIGGKANDQVEKYKRIVIAEVEVSSYKLTYTLGKNHMVDLRHEELFSLHHQHSKVFNFPLPAAVMFYRELKQIHALDHGIHRIHFYEVVNHEIVQKSSSTLAHIHQYYAQWRLDSGLITHLLYR